MKAQRVEAYVAALLQNPAFVHAAAKRYGQLQSSEGDGLVPNLSMAQLSKAVADLERELMSDLIETSN